MDHVGHWGAKKTDQPDGRTNSQLGGSNKDWVIFVKFGTFHNQFGWNLPQIIVFF